MDTGTLFVVATPIGNLEDLSPRARQILIDADLIAAEDTRHTGRLLSHFGINTRQIAFHDHNEEMAVAKLVSALKKGRSIALVSDAGTPLISDPGYRLVRAAHEAGLRVSPVPGACALTAALCVAGLPTDRFCFEGFLPGKKTARVKKLRQLDEESRSLVFYESVHRLRDTIGDLAEVLGAGRAAFVGRELSKIHEQCTLSSLGDLRTLIDDGKIPLKGEFVIVVEGNTGPAAEVATVAVGKMVAEISAVLPANQAADLISSLSGRRRNEIYPMVLKERGD